MSALQKTRGESLISSGTKYKVTLPLLLLLVVVLEIATAVNKAIGCVKLHIVPKVNRVLAAAVCIAIPMMAQTTAARPSASRRVAETRLIAIESGIPVLTPEERVFGLSRIWRDAKTYFPFWTNLKDLDWDASYLEMLKNVLKEIDAREYYLELSKFVALLGDGHTTLYFPDEVQKKVGMFPVIFEYVDGKLYIATCDKSIDIDQNTEALKINKMDALDYVHKNIHPYTWHKKLDSSYSRMNYLLPFIEYGKEIEITTEKLTLKVKATASEKINWKLRTPIFRSEPLTELFNSGGLRVELTNDNIAVITIPTFMYGDLQKEFYSILPKIEKCSGFIIDVRNNVGGMSMYGWSVAQAFIKNKNFETLKVKKAAFVGYPSLLEEMVSANDFACPIHLAQPLIVLVNQKTGSAAEDFLVCLDYAKRATLVGASSNGSTGTPEMVSLPGGGGARICTAWHSYPDGKEYVNIGVQPHVHSELSLDDIKNKHDSVFEKGIEILREKIKNTPED